MEQLIVIKYGELTTKKGNRNTFINALKNNIKRVLVNNDYNIIANRDHIYIETKEIDDVLKKLKKVCGIQGILVAYKVNTNTDTIKEEVLNILKNMTFKTFKVETKRALKSFPINSMEFSRIIGGHILKNIPNINVDVHKPDVLVKIEIREDTYIYFNEIKGIGGYPAGIQGKGLLMLSGGIDSPVAGYMALKRGIDIDCLYFESPPHTSLQAKEKVVKIASILNEYSGNVRLLVVPFTKLQEEIYKNVLSEYNITILRRMMYRIASRLGYKVLINGESVGQVASQTIDSMYVINSVTNLPIIRPVSCLDKLEIIDIAKKIGTYETSILPYEDCCTIFVPKHPVINPKIEKCLLYENFSYEDLIEECINNIEIIDNFNKKYTNYL
ncbi:MAG: tRNA uracil 4-sulfurtransferase ThiI [Candidatus Faecisoma sp.]|nr:tRNA 4-thiouridine(8) synthase ThiI [Acholeplasma sp.]MDY2892939.1 tRNA uracil 4-sulfurtransferase ThiI [Candidatus Faecisoma sp.]